MKSVARLTGSLLARKGFAAPAQESAAYALSHHMPGEAAPSSVTSFPAPSFVTPAPTPATVEALQDRIAREISEPEAGAAPKTAKPQKAAATPKETATPLPQVAAGPRVAMTLRLDNERHLKLRVFSAHSKLSSQEILTAALDEYLERHAATLALNHCECLQQGLTPGKDRCPRG